MNNYDSIAIANASILMILRGVIINNFEFNLVGH